MSDEQLDRRAMLEAAMDSALEEPEENVIEQESLETEAVLETDNAEESLKEEVGITDNEESAEILEAVESADKDEAEEAAEEVKPVTRPSTWKKEYVTIWDKMEKGEQISKEDFTKFAEYANQRESEYKKGVSTYKAEADRARGYEEAIAPFVSELQAQNISPAAWINNLGRAHMILSKAPMEQKLEMFQRLAQDYGIQFNGESVASAQQLDPYTQQLMNQLNQVNQEVSTIKSRFQQEENQRLMNEIEKYRSDVEKFPHFDVVREEMAQLLELGKAQDLETAYEKAIWNVPEIRELEIKKLVSKHEEKVTKASQVAKAKAAAVSPKSTTPSGKVSNPEDKKDRRSLISEQLGEAMSRRV